MEIGRHADRGRALPIHPPTVGRFLGGTTSCQVRIATAPQPTRPNVTTHGHVTRKSSSQPSLRRALQTSTSFGQPAVCQPEKRKVDSSILSLTTSPEETCAALTSGNIRCCARLRTLLLALSNPLATADRRALVHAECTDRPGWPASRMQTIGAYDD